MRRSGHGATGRRAAVLALVALVAAVAAACAFRALPGNPLARELDVEREREVTGEVARQIRAQAPMVNDPVLLAYLNELGQSIVRVTEPQPFIYRFSIIENEGLNAFTIGGGHVYLNSGVIAQAGDVGELAGVLAHEIAHVRKRHVARRGEGQGIATLATLAAMAAVALAGADPSVLVISQAVNVALQLKHSRAHESEADREGIEYLVRAGYDPEGLTRFFQRLVAAYPGAGDIPPYLYTHPAVKERIAATRVEIERAEAPRGLRRADLRLAEMQERLAALLSPVAGGSGLQARAQFDRAATDPALERAERLADDGREDLADALLAEAEAVEPSDPRVALARADLAEKRRDWVSAERHLTRAFELDPGVALVLYRLGLNHARLGNRSQAVFYLEQAAGRYNTGTSGQQRAEQEIDRVTFPVLVESGLDRGARRLLGRSDTVRWWGKLRERYRKKPPTLEVRWIDPAGEVERSDHIHTHAEGTVEARIETSGLAPGSWTVEVVAGESPVDQRDFDL